MIITITAVIIITTTTTTTTTIGTKTSLNIHHYISFVFTVYLDGKIRSFSMNTATDKIENRNNKNTVSRKSLQPIKER